MKEWSDSQIQYDIDADPLLGTPNKPTLSKEGYIPRENHVYLQNGENIICFKNVAKCDEGTYTIASSNVVGEGKASFYVKIRCKQIML